MIVITGDGFNTYHAQIRSEAGNGFLKLYAGSCTAGEKNAAWHLVNKWFGPDVANTLRQVTDKREIDMRCGEGAMLRLTRFRNVWSFDQSGLNKGES